MSGLTKAAIIEIQAAAKHNTLRLMREAEEQKEFKLQVAKEIKESQTPTAVKAEVEAKTPVKAAKKGK
jgi:hypothetical protein